ncbi:pyridoxal phosphate-dependent aminotransferase [Halorubellus sp. JP-L1]|uniref:pyridoxal phosphate-dependent aminotransferase n=1 Tax=Halorubellus sp. JP-L1 TaxID=2715753 RepID=UPI0014072C34|nr:pyridoxal phosphate-dependent aminotransferase [Halorubellus sp. JP-L1]
MFEQLSYLSWIEGRPDAVAHDLASSDLRPQTPSPGPVPDRLAAVPDPPADTDLDALVADAYDVAPENVLVTAGATNANALAFAVAAEGRPRVTDHDGGGDDSSQRVLVEKPGYEPLTGTPRGFGARVDRFMRPQGILDPTRVEAAVTERTALVAITDRHNPTGRRADRDSLDATVDVARDADVPLLVDEVYASFTTTATDGPLGGPSVAGTDGVVVTGSLTKFLGFGGLRIGWLVADHEFVAGTERVQQHLPSVAEPSVALAKRALAAHDDLAADRRERIRHNHDHLASFVHDRPALSGHVHDGATYALLTHDDVDGDELAERALEDDVLVVPGRFFDRPDAVRVSLGRPTEHATAALDAFALVLDDLD